MYVRPLTTGQIEPLRRWIWVIDAASAVWSRSRPG